MPGTVEEKKTLVNESNGGYVTQSMTLSIHFVIMHLLLCRNKFMLLVFSQGTRMLITSLRNSSSLERIALL